MLRIRTEARSSRTENPAWRFVIASLLEDGVERDRVASVLVPGDRDRERLAGGGRPGTHGPRPGVRLAPPGRVDGVRSPGHDAGRVPDLLELGLSETRGGRQAPRLAHAMDARDQERNEARQHDAGERQRHQHLDERESPGAARPDAPSALHWTRILPAALTMTVLLCALPVTVMVAACVAVPSGTKVRVPLVLPVSPEKDRHHEDAREQLEEARTPLR